MNLRSGIKNLCAALSFQRRQSHFAGRIFGQDAPAGLESSKSIMSLLFARRAAICFCWGLFLVIPAAVFGQTNYYANNGTEYPVIGSLPGDQVFPDAAVTPSGGFMVWQDNITDGDGWGVSAQRLDGTLSGTLGTFRVNAQGAGDQENPRVALLQNGGAVFVWQGGVQGSQHIYARFLTSSNTFLTTGDVLVNTFTNNFQINPAVAVLNNGNVVVVWASFDEANSDSLQDVYGQIFSPSGQKIGGEFLINQFVSYNQRTPAVAALAGGGFAVAWVSEQQRVAPSSLDNSFYAAGGAAYVSTNEEAIGQDTNYLASSSAAQTPSVDIYARLYTSNGVATNDEFLVNVDSNPCANPDMAAADDGGFMVTWGEKDLVNQQNSWDIYARSFSSAGAGGTVLRVNTHLYGDQYAPRISVIGTDYLIVWTSLGQDGSREGVFGQFISESGSLTGGEIRGNTTTSGQQMQPVVASDGVEQFLVMWTGFTGSPDDFDLFAQRYGNVAALVEPMAAPFVWAPFTLSNNVYQPQLVVSWPVLQGISVSNYEVYVDGAVTPSGIIASNQIINGQYYQWTMTALNGLTTNSTHSFQVDYVTTFGARPSLSPSTSGTTWSGLNWGGIPYEWMAEFFGGYFGGAYHTNFWQSAGTPAISGGPTLAQIFLTGGSPFDSTTWLKTTLVATPQGVLLSWNTQPGLTYQVQVKTNLTAAWSNYGTPRFAAGTTDQINFGSSSAGFYQIMLLR
jgi:hypothetical protein